jgi:hypothetical protein
VSFQPLVGRRWRLPGPTSQFHRNCAMSDQIKQIAECKKSPRNVPGQMSLFDAPESVTLDEVRNELCSVATSSASPTTGHHELDIAKPSIAPRVPSTPPAALNTDVLLSIQVPTEMPLRQDRQLDVGDLGGTAPTKQSAPWFDAELAAGPIVGMAPFEDSSANSAENDVCRDANEREARSNRSPHEAILALQTAGYRRGVGKPSSRPLLLNEFDRLAFNGECPIELSLLTVHLSDWLQREYPDQPQMTQKTVENALRQLRRKHLDQLYPVPPVGGQRNGVVRRSLPPGPRHVP